MAMYVKRVQIDEGFLDGLDLALQPGLNVLFGPRGVGKTSLIQLLRFCLGASAHSEDVAAAARAHALAILGEGEITVTLSDGTSDMVVSRTAEEDLPRSDGPIPSVTVLGPNEIETISLSPVGRLRLLDTLWSDRDGYRRREAQIRAAIRGHTERIGSLASEIAALDAELLIRDGALASLAAERTAQEELLGRIAATASDREALTRLVAQSSALAAEGDAISRAAAAITRLAEGLADLPSIPDELTETSGFVRLGPATQRAVRVSQLLGRLRSEVAALDADLRTAGQQHSSVRLEAEQSARDLRRRLDALEEGAGSSAQRIAKLQQDVDRLADIASRRQKRAAEFSRIVRQRGELFDEWDHLRQQRLEQRRGIAEHLNGELGPAIQVDIRQSEITTEYMNAVANVLRGSGLHHGTLSPRLAEQMTPRELVEAIEHGDVDAIATAAGIQPTRAARIIEQGRDNGIAEVASARIEDGVVLKLLDGREYKETPELSTGQRCTIVLPILLTMASDLLIVDQPEDNLDNAFIATTIVPSLIRRKIDSQLLFSTHNANIPVLGGADRVVLLGSDGKRGFVRLASELEDPRSVEAIVTVMEGGEDAFRSRAAFYGR
ncbi:MAG: hypothetical protein AB1627_07500 [Chloroflexota bacterium]